MCIEVGVCLIQPIINCLVKKLHILIRCFKIKLVINSASQLNQTGFFYKWVRNDHWRSNRAKNGVASGKCLNTTQNRQFHFTYFNRIANLYIKLKHHCSIEQGTLLFLKIFSRRLWLRLQLSVEWKSVADPPHLKQFGRLIFWKQCHRGKRNFFSICSS